MFDGLKKAIIDALTYFDLMEYPLTLMEIDKWVHGGTGIVATQEGLESLLGEGAIGAFNGFYFLPGRELFVSQRLSRYSMADRKFKKAARIIKVLRLFPWLRGVAIYSSLSFNNSHRNSDIDLFIVAESNRVWSCRFWVNVFLKLFALRPNKRISRDKICVSFLVSREGTDFSALAEEGQDQFYTYGTSQFVFLYCQNDEAEKFFTANRWINKAMSGWTPYNINQKRKIGNKFMSLKNSLENIFSVIPESAYRKIQMVIMPNKLKEKQNKDKSVIVDDSTIKLHSNDRGVSVNKNYHERIKN